MRPLLALLALLAWIAAALLVLAATPAAKADGCGSRCATIYTPHEAHNEYVHFDAPRDVFLFLPLSITPVAAPTAPVTPAPAPAPAAAPVEEPLPPRATGYAVGAGATNTAPAGVARLATDLQICAACHSPDKRKGDVQLFDLAGRFAPSVSLRTILSAVTDPDNPMPPKGPPLPPDVIERLRQFAAANP